MMTGRVTARREATLRLTVLGPDQRQHAVDAVLDPGFNGFLTLPSHVVRTLRLPFVGHRRADPGEWLYRRGRSAPWPPFSGMSKIARCSVAG